jgi:hypothetical protein
LFQCLATEFVIDTKKQNHILKWVEDMTMGKNDVMNVIFSSNGLANDVLAVADYLD